MVGANIYTAHHAALLSLILLLITFLFFDAHHWHILPLPWPSTYYPSSIKESPHANYGLIDKFVALNLTNSHYDSLNSSTGAQVIFNTSSSFSSKSNEKATTYNMATPQDAINSSATTSIIPPPEILSLRRLEAELRTVRSALRKVVRMRKNGTRSLRARKHRKQRARDYQKQQPPDYQNQEYLPWGHIYRDASIFHQSYMEMERRFKVFIYPEGNEPLVHNGPCKSIYSTEGRFIQELQHNNHFVTSDPFRAHVFFLPFSVSMMVTYLYNPNSRDIHPLLHFVKEYIKVVRAKYPFWNRSSGADHFMLSCHDWGPRVSKAETHLEKHAIRVLCNANSSEGFVPNKDASLPEINLVGGYIPAALGGPSMKDRKFLAFFAGQDHGPVRPILYKYWEGKDDDIKVFHKLPANAIYTYQDFMKRSKFCLCPGGYEVNSPRAVEAIYNDCIPVIIADSFVLPFSDVLNWDAFSIKVMQKDIPKLKEILQAIPESKCEELQAGVKQVKRHFLLNQTPQPYDLFHMILHSVWLRRLNIRLDYH